MSEVSPTPKLPTYPTPWSQCQTAVQALYGGCSLLPWILLAHEFRWLSAERTAGRDTGAAIGFSTAATRVWEVIAEVRGIDAVPQPTRSRDYTCVHNRAPGQFCGICDSSPSPTMPAEHRAKQINAAV